MIRHLLGHFLLAVIRFCGGTEAEWRPRHFGMYRDRHHAGKACGEPWFGSRTLKPLTWPWAEVRGLSDAEFARRLRR